MLKNCLLGVLLVSCGDGRDARRVDVAANALGVTTLEIAQGAETFELRGLDADDTEVASVRLRTGTIADLPTLLPGTGTLGSELVLAHRGAPSQRIVSRETHLFQPGRARDDAMQGFLELGEVTTALGAANIRVRPEAPATTETAYSVNGCSSGVLNTSPTAGQCCYTVGDGVMSYWGDTYTEFVRGSDGAIVHRVQNPYGTPCTDSDGVSPCSGGGCYYGPNGFARASIDGSGPYARVDMDLACYGFYCFPQTCTGHWYGSPQTAMFGDVDGDFPTGGTCCGDGSGPCFGEDCFNCTGGDAGGWGEWDY